MICSISHTTEQVPKDWLCLETGGLRGSEFTAVSPGTADGLEPLSPTAKIRPGYRLIKRNSKKAKESGKVEPRMNVAGAGLATR